jgi:cupin fold WbuC family metalloprotein
MIRTIDKTLLDEVSTEAQAAERRRRNRNFHPHDDYPANRLLNAIEPGSYVMPHRHAEPTKDETIIVLRGCLGMAVFDDAGELVQALRLGPAENALGVDIAHGTWHSVFALVAGTVFFEAKAGPYRPLTEAERAPWAPSEGSTEAARYLAHLVEQVAASG